MYPIGVAVGTGVGVAGIGVTVGTDVAVGMGVGTGVGAAVGTGVAVEVGAGVGTAFAFGLLKPVFVAMSQLSSMELPILGVVTMVSSSAELTSSRRSNVVFVVGVSFLFALAVGYAIALDLGILERLA